jgi:Lon protease-like protein
MSDPTRIPIFPLSILPLPGELVPLHIFEPRYRQLLQDIETRDITFGIYFTHEINTAKVGSIMRLESVIKRYPDGKSDIIVKCEDVFSLDMLLRTFKDKMYPGGDVRLWKTDMMAFPHEDLYRRFLDFLKLRNINQHSVPFNIFQIANELSLDVNDRYKFLTSSDEQRELFLANRIRFQTHLLQQEEKSKDVYHLN